MGADGNIHAQAGRYGDGGPLCQGNALTAVKSLRYCRFQAPAAVSRRPRQNRGEGWVWSAFAPRVLAVLLAMGAPGSAQAQGYPSRPVNVIVPFPAGGSTDWLARMLSQKLEQRLKGTTSWSRTGPGGANVVAAVSVAKAPPDGHTLLMTTSTTMAINVSVFKNLRLRPGQGFRAGRAGVGRAVRAGGQCLRCR